MPGHLNNNQWRWLYGMPPECLSRAVLIICVLTKLQTSSTCSNNYINGLLFTCSLHPTHHIIDCVFCFWCHPVLLVICVIQYFLWSCILYTWHESYIVRSYINSMNWLYKHQPALQKRYQANSVKKSCAVYPMWAHMHELSMTYVGLLYCIQEGMFQDRVSHACSIEMTLQTDVRA